MTTSESNAHLKRAGKPLTDEIDFSEFSKEVVDGLREAGWVLIPPSRVIEFKMLVEMVMDVYLKTPEFPEEK